MVTVSIAVESRTLGGGGCFIIAEAGVNHNGDSSLAHQMVDIAADSGADAIKFQTFEPERLVAAGAPLAKYQASATSVHRSQRELLGQLVLPRSIHCELRQHAAERGVVFLSTPFDERSADFLEELEIPLFKVPSGELTNHSFLEHLARKHRPLLMSTGMSTLEEVAAGVEVVRSNGNPPLALMHCVTNYPASPAECNLRAMDTLRAKFDVPVGWSDHTMGIVISCAAVALGADVIEKHFTTDRSLPGPDHRASLEPSELTRLVQSVREVTASLGDGVKRPTPAEREISSVVRRSLHAVRDLPAGHVMRPEDVKALRPGSGIAPSRIGEVTGRVLRVAVRNGQMISETDLG